MPASSFFNPLRSRSWNNALRGRATDDEKAIQERLAQARKEMDYARQDGAHDKIIVQR